MMMTSFSVKVEGGRESRDGKLAVGPIYRCPLSVPDFPPPDPQITSAWDSFRLSAEKNAGNRMLGWREKINGKFGPYVWKNYKEVYEDVLKIGSALRQCGAEPGARVGIYGANCPQWAVAMEACSAYSLICVPLYDTLGHGAVNFIISHAEIDFVFVQDKKVKELQNNDCTSARRLKFMVCFTSFSEEEKTKANDADIRSFSWNEFLQMGKQNSLKPVPPKSSDICTIMYTSGTTGDPKGVIITHENIAWIIRGVDLFMEQFEDKMTVDDAYLSFLPLAHILDRAIEEYFFRKGASVGYYHGDLNELRDDLMELKPTFFAGVPRVFEKVYEGIQSAVAELNPRRRMIFGLLYKYKLAWMNKGYKEKNASPLADLIAFRKVKSRLGGRVRLIVSGAAPLSSEIEEFLRVTCGCYVLQGYGMTETCGLASCCYPDEMSLLGTVGGVFVYNELRLEEVPEMGYHPLRDPPQGEICLRGKTIFTGYYKNPELTEESFRDGWFHTGDVGEMLPDGAIKIIDRKKNLIKLSQGEYIAVEHLEKIYSVCPIVEDIWVYGDSFRSMLVAVVVPNEEHARKWAEKNGHNSSLSEVELCSLDELKSYVITELKSAAERNKLRGFQYVKGIALEPKSFELAATDLLTPTLKKRRNIMLKHYQAQIDELYRALCKGKN